MKKLNYNDFIIVKGGEFNYEYNYNNDTHILNLNCNDYYEGLPEKVMKTLQFINNNILFQDYKYICKFDDDIIINKLFNINNLFDYCGCILITGYRQWHIGKCSKNNIYNTTPYKGIYVPFCSGGMGYILSNNSISILVKDKNYKNEIYEDVYIAKILHKNKIYPTYLNMTEYIYSKDHSPLHTQTK